MWQISASPAGVPNVLVAGGAPHILHPCFHAVILLCQDAEIAISEVHRPRDNDGCIGPPRGGGSSLARLAGKRVANHVGDGAVVLLVERQILQPFGIKAGDVMEERCRRRKNLRIARPAQPLIALGTVRGDIQKIAFLSPDDVVLQLIDQRAGTFKFPG